MGVKFQTTVLLDEVIRNNALRVSPSLIASSFDMFGDGGCNQVTPGGRDNEIT